MIRPIYLALAALVLFPRPLSGQTLNDFFDHRALHEVRINIAPADLQTLRDRYLDNTYYRCDFQWRDIQLTNVGIRSRGSGTRNPLKPNFGFDFSRYDKPQRFLTLKSLVTRNFAQDPSMAREFLTVRLFARMGLPYLRESFAKIFLNGEYAGLYLMVEPIDQRFLLSHFGEDTGYLYEGKFAGTPYHFEYLGEDPKRYLPDLFEPKTHEDDPDAARLIGMIRTANQAPDSGFVEAMNEYLDLDQFVAHLAVEQFLAENDGVLGYGGMTNYYLYRRMTDNRFTLILWDKDNTFSGTDRSVWANAELNVLARRTLDDPAMRQRFLQTLMHAAESAGAEGGWLDAERARVYALIREAALADPLRVCAFDDGIKLCAGPEFEFHHEYLDGFAASRRSFVVDEVEAAGLVTNARAPALRAGAAMNLASSDTILTPGGLGRIVMQSALSEVAWARAVPWPTELAGVTVTLAGRAVPLLLVSPWEIQFQVPWKIPCGAQALQVTWRGNQDHAIDVEVRPAAAGVFAVTHADWSLVNWSAPARPGETLVIFGTGYALPNVQQETGWPAPVDRVVSTGQVVRATVAGCASQVLFAGLAPGFIGVSQLVLVMPLELPTAGPVPLLLIVDGEPGAPYLLDVMP